MGFPNPYNLLIDFFAGKGRRATTKAIKFQENSVVLVNKLQMSFSYDYFVISVKEKGNEEKFYEESLN